MKMATPTKCLSDEVDELIQEVEEKARKRIGIYILARVYERLNERLKPSSEDILRCLDGSREINQEIVAEYNARLASKYFFENHARQNFNITSNGLQAVLKNSKFLNP